MAREDQRKAEERLVTWYGAASFPTSVGATQRLRTVTANGERHPSWYTQGATQRGRHTDAEGEGTLCS
jgi:hypothetical protein